MLAGSACACLSGCGFLCQRVLERLFVHICYSFTAQVSTELYQYVLVCDSSTLEQASDEFHALEDLLFLEASPNDLHANG